jgi:hypothetical protein
MGQDVYRLILPKDLLRLHPVFHKSLLLPYIDPKSYPNHIGSKGPRGPALLNPDFWNEHDVEALLGYRSPEKNIHEYLVRWCGGSMANDSWERGFMFSPTLHPYLEQLHNKFSGDNIIFSPKQVIQDFVLGTWGVIVSTTGKTGGKNSKQKIIIFKIQQQLNQDLT